MKDINIEELESICFDAIVSRMSIHAFVQEFYKSIRLPILCLDVTLQAFDYAFKRPFYFPAWESAAARNLSESEILNNGYLKSQEKMYEVKCASIFETGSNAPAPASASPIIHNEELIGYCGIMLEDADREKVMEANNLLSKTLAVMLSHELGEGIVSIADDKAISELLTRGQLVNQPAFHFEMRYPAKYAFAIFRSRENSVSVLQYCRKTLCTMNTSVIGCISEDDRLYLLYYDLHESSMEQLAVESAYLARKFNLSCGISDIFPFIHEINSHRIQAQLALSYGERTGGERVTSFREHYSDIVCYSSYNWFGPSGKYCYNIGKLEDYDRENGTEYFSCFETYLLNFCSVAEVSRILNIHKNTTAYRLKKIEEILGCDLSDPYKRRTLFLELMFCKFRDRLRKAEKNDGAE